MNDLTKLPAQLMADAKEEVDIDEHNRLWSSGVNYAAHVFSNALPVWIEISDNMEKLPNNFIAYFDNGTVDMYNLKDGHNLDYALIHSGMTHWRKLCDLDFPPGRTP